MASQESQILRGRVLTFVAEPQSADDHDAYRYIEDGALLIDNGLISACGTYDEISPLASDATVTDHRPHLLMAGFIDTHIHFPQIQVIASSAPQLLDWLNNYTFPAEIRFSDEAHCQLMAAAFCDQLVNHGTTTAVAYGSVHASSVEALFTEAAKRNMCMIGGKVLMDRNAPADLLDTPQTAYDDSKMLIEKWHGHGRLHYAITPRFAITSTPEQMDAVSTLVAEHPESYVQTHLSENLDEIAFTAELYPQARDYLDIYQSYGLLGSKTLLGHAIHLQPREIDVLAETGSCAVFCPTSNLFLGSGLFKLSALQQCNITTAIATDVGGGTSYSMLQTLSEGYKILQLQGYTMHTLLAFHWITRGNAAALGLEHKIGSLDAGSDADIVVLNATATPAMALRMETVTTLSEELFILQMMGDDRAIEQVYIAGSAVKTAII